jgi:hypothetical protein
LCAPASVPSADFDSPPLEFAVDKYQIDARSPSFFKNDTAAIVCVSRNLVYKICLLGMIIFMGTVQNFRQQLALTCLPARRKSTRMPTFHFVIQNSIAASLSLCMGTTELEGLQEVYFIRYYAADTLMGTLVKI